MSDSANLTPDNDAAQGVDLLALAAEYETHAASVDILSSQQARRIKAERLAVAAALREKATRDAAPADPDLTPSDLEVCARECETCAEGLERATHPKYGSGEAGRKKAVELRATARAIRFYAAAIDGRSQAAPADLRALKHGDRITVDATFGEYGYESDGIVHRNDVALIDVPQFGATKARTIHPVPVASLHPAAPPAQHPEGGRPKC